MQSILGPFKIISGGRFLVSSGRSWSVLVNFGRFCMWSVLGRLVGFGWFWSVLFGFWSVLSAWSVPAGILGRFGRVMVGSDLCVLSSFTV